MIGDNTSFGAALSSVIVPARYIDKLATWRSISDVAVGKPDSSSRSRSGVRDYVKVEVEVCSAIFLLPSYYATAYSFSSKDAGARRPAQRDAVWQVSRGNAWEPYSREPGPSELTYKIALAYARRCVFRDYARMLVRSGLQTHLSGWGQVFLARELGLLVTEDGSDWTAQITPAARCSLVIGEGMSITMLADGVQLVAGAATCTLTPVQPELTDASEFAELAATFWQLLCEKNADTDQCRLEQAT